MNETEESEKDMELIAQAFRWPKYGMSERLVAQHLFTSTCTNNKSAIIQNVCRAAMKVETILRKDQKIEGVDFPLLRGIYTIDGCLSNPEFIKFDYVWSGSRWDYRKMVRIHWNFETSGDKGKNNYEKLIRSWAPVVGCWMKFLKVSKEKRVIVKCPRCGFVLLDEPVKRYEEVIGDKPTLIHVLAEIYGETVTVEIEKQNPRYLSGGNPLWIKEPVTLHYVVCPNCKNKYRMEEFVDIRTENIWGLPEKYLSRNENLKMLEQEDTVGELKVGEKEGFDWSRPWTVFFESTWFMKESGLLQLCGSFYDWAVPICEDVCVKLSQLISPETLKDVERLMVAQKEVGGERESEGFLEER